MKNQLDETEANAMTVNERLAASGLLEDFDQAAARGDETELRRILSGLYLDSKTIQATIEQVRRENDG